MNKLFRCVQASFFLISAITSTQSFADEANILDMQPCSDNFAEDGVAQPENTLNFTASPYTHHWSYNPEHKQVMLVALDRQVAGGRFCGMALFTNSFGQASTYLYLGKQWSGLWGDPQIFTKISAGFIYGYRGQYKDKIPFNQMGIAPAIIPSLGYMLTPKSSAQVFMLGNAGLLFAYGYSF